MSIVPKGFLLIDAVFDEVGKKLFQNEWTGTEIRILHNQRTLQNPEMMAMFGGRSPYLSTAEGLDHYNASIGRYSRVKWEILRQLAHGERSSCWIDRASGELKPLEVSFWLRDASEATLESLNVTHPDNGGVGILFVSPVRSNISSKNKGGRPPHDWPSFLIEVIRLANLPDGLPDGQAKQAQLERIMMAWCEKEWSEVGETSVRDMVRRIYRSIDEGAKT